MPNIEFSLARADYLDLLTQAEAANMSEHQYVKYMYLAYRRNHDMARVMAEKNSRTKKRAAGMREKIQRAGLRPIV